MSREPNVAELNGEIAIVGDIHGQFFDMISMLEELIPKLEDNNSDFGILFLGDYVDRGMRGVEVLMFLMALKINFPKKVTLLRGNHESREMTSSFSFRQECLSKYDMEVYESFCELFDSMLCMAVVNGLYLCMHAGISPEMFEVSDVNHKVDRFQEPPSFGLQCDIMWSDPCDQEMNPQETKFKQNDVRMCSFYYGMQPVKELLRRERMLCVIRAHEVKMDGYEMKMWEGDE